MKLRIGFVSNSSSSSFVVGIKGNISKKQIRDKLLELLKVPEESLLYEVATGIAKFVSDNMKKVTKAKLVEDWGSYEEVPNEQKQILDKGYTLYEGSATNETDDYIEQLFVEMELDYTDDNLIIKKEGGF